MESIEISIASLSNWTLSLPKIVSNIFILESLLDEGPIQ